MNEKHKKLWGGRFSSSTAQDVADYTESISFDAVLALEDILGSLAHAQMLAHVGILTEEEKNAICEGLQGIADDVKQKKIEWRKEDEDVHMNVERILTERIGDVAKKLHTARSRNDQVALDVHLYLRKHILLIMHSLLELQSTLLTLAKEHMHVILPGYTHLQRAQPIRLSQQWLAYVAMLQRDVDRLKVLWPRVNKSPLGAAALTGTSFPIDRLFVAQQLGFDGIYQNTLDAVSDRDFVVDFLAAASLIMMHVSRMSEGLILWASQEFNFIQFDDAYCTGSSIMPQKKNPDIAELSRGKTGRVYGSLFTLLTTLKGLPLAYNRDMQEDKEPLFDTIKQVSYTLKIYLPLLKTMKINPKEMYQATQEGYLNATILAEYLVKKGMPFRSAHEVVGKMVAHCTQKKCRLEDLTLEEMQPYSSSIKEDIYEVLSIENAVEACMPLSRVEQEIAIDEQQMKEDFEWLSSKESILERVYNSLGSEKNSPMTIKARL